MGKVAFYFREKQFFCELAMITEESDEEGNLEEQITLEKQRIKNYIREKGSKEGVNLSSMHNELLIKFKRLGFRRLIDFVLTVNLCFFFCGRHQQ